MVGVRGNEDDGRWLRQRAQRVRQRQPILAGHVDVEQHGIDGAAAGRLQQRQSLGGVRGLALKDEDIARTIKFALDQPPGVDLNEILIRPITQAS